MLNQAAAFLLQTLFNLFLIILLLRFFMQAMRAPFRNPIGQFVAAATDFAVKPARRVVPGLRGLDLATLVVAWLVEIALVFALRWLDGFPFLVAGASAYLVLLPLAAVRLLALSINLLIWVAIAQAVLSWVNPYHWATGITNSLSRPFLRVFQRLIPPIGNVDLSPLFLIIVCQLILMLPVAWLESQVLSMM